MVDYIFDAPNKLIKIPSPETTISVLDMYSRSQEWADENMQYHCPLNALGKAPLGGGVYTDSIFILRYGWKIKPYDGNYQLIILGTVITDDGSRRTTSPDNGTVDVIFQVSSQGIITIQGSGVTSEDKIDISNLVWSHSTGDSLSTRVDYLRKVEEGKWKIYNNQLIIYDPSGGTLKVFNLFDKDGNPATENVYERVPA